MAYNPSNFAFFYGLVRIYFCWWLVKTCLMSISSNNTFFNGLQYVLFEDENIISSHFDVIDIVI
jgi:hypothetical protein